MGAWADSLFTVLMSWVRALVNGIWALFSSDHTTILEFLGKNWIMIAAVLIAAGLVIDWLVWLVRWQPYHLWARRLRRLLRIPDPQEDEEEPRRRATPAQHPAMRRESACEPEAEQAYEPAYGPEEENTRASEWMPLAQPGEEETRQMIAQAESVPDESLGAYPGMRYGAAEAAQPRAEDTMRYAAVHAEGPGAAEVARRRGEIDAWQRQMQEDARRQAEAERARRAQEAYEAEQERLAQEAYEAEQARLAQEEYERQLEEYERQRAQYELDLAEYERQKAAYDAQMAAQQTGQWQRMDAAPEAGETGPRAAKTRRNGGVMGRMAQMLEPEDEEITGVRALPPRVSVNEAYGPAKKPPQSAKRRR